MKTFDIKLPKTINDFRIGHLKAFSDESFKDGNITLNTKVLFLANITLVSVAKLMTVDVNDINTMFDYCINLFSEFKMSGKPPKEIEIEGQIFTFVDPKQAPIGFHIDCQHSDFVKDPVLLACTCYIPKGTNYGQLDIHENILYPRSSRYELFKNHFKMVDFIELNGFFLKKYVELIDSYTESQRIKKKLSRINLLGKK
jgi:hypothetical protein